MHGGGSCGPRSPAGKERCRQANWKHGKRSQAYRERQQYWRNCLRVFKSELKELERELRAFVGARKRAIAAGEEKANIIVLSSLRLGTPCKCRVSFEDSSGILHTAEVTAETVYEAAVLGIRAINTHWAEEPWLMTRIAVEVVAPAVRHEVTFKALREWIDKGSGSPKEMAQRSRLKTMLEQP